MEKWKWRNLVYVTAAVILASVAVLSDAQPVGSSIDSPVNIAARRGGKTSEVCVTNAAGGTTISAFAGRKAVELQNLGPNSIFCTVDGQSPLSTGALGRRILSGDPWSLDAGSNVTLKCIAATAAQVTGACTQVTELR